MYLTKAQQKALDYCKTEIAKARMVDLSTMSKKELAQAKRIADAQNGIVLCPASIITLRNLEEKGYIKIVLDNSGIGTGSGAFPSVVQVIEDRGED